MSRDPQKNERAPIQETGQLSPPIVREPIYECAAAVHVESFVAHAVVTVFSNGVDVVGKDKPYMGQADIQLTRPLKADEKITATQDAFGLTSEQSYKPVTVQPQITKLEKPTAGPIIYACGRVVPVRGLSPSTHVEVYQAQSSPVPIIPANLIGTAENTGVWVPVVTQPLKKGWFVAARQVSCPGTPHEIDSAPSDSLSVPPELSPVTPPILDQPIAGNDVVNLEQLLVGSEIKVTDENTASTVGGGLATGDKNWAPVDPNIDGSHKYHAIQTLCTPSKPSPSVTPIKNVGAAALFSPICPDDMTVTVGGSIINANVVLYRDGSALPIGIGGAVDGELTLSIGPAFLPLKVGEQLYVRQYIGSTISDKSNVVTVTDCRNVVTQHNDMRRTGAYLHETSLTPTTVSGPHFGRLFERNVDGSPYAQILYVRGVPNTAQGTKDLFFVATSTNWIYAFDADNTAQDPNTPAVWHVHLGRTRMLNANEICRETLGSVGVTSTPVIDVQTQTMYVVAEHWQSATPTPSGSANLDGEHFLHAIRLNDGKDRVPPVKIAGHDPRTGLDFDHKVQRNRPGLLLLNGAVYIGCATFSCDAGNYHGWVFGYRASDLKPVGIFCTSERSDIGSGVWQSGNGLVGSDGGHIYFETGNDLGEPGSPVAKYGDTFIRLRVTSEWPGLVEANYFQPSNALRLRDGDRDAQGNAIPDDGKYANGTPHYDHWGDTDLGSGGPILLPGGRLVGGGKQGRYYVLDSQSMRLVQDKNSPDPAKVGEGFQAFVTSYRDVAGDLISNFQIYGAAEGFGPNIHGGPCYWRDRGLLYQMSEKDYLKAFQYDILSGTVQQQPVLKSTVQPPYGMPGGHSSLSANGDKDGVLWTCMPNGDGQWIPQQGILIAFDATTLKELWRDTGDPDTNPEWFAKFNPPTVADGRVYRPCFARYSVSVGSDGKDNGGAPTQAAPGKVIIYGLTGKKKHKRHSSSAHDLANSSIDAKWQSLGGSGVLAAPGGDEYAVGDSRGGRRRDFVGAVTAPSQRVSLRHLPTGGSCHNPPDQSAMVVSSIFWTAETGACVVTGEIREHYLRNSGPTGELGYPVSDETDTADGTGRVSYFENGYIIWDSQHGATMRLLR